VVEAAAAVADRATFTHELNAVHVSSASRAAGSEEEQFCNPLDKLPRLGGEEVDLHHIFFEVHKRGGYDLAVENKQWSSVCTTLGYDLTRLTSGATGMRRAYERCLLDFERHLARRAAESVDDAGAPGAPKKKNKKKRKSSKGDDDFPHADYCRSNTDGCRS
jgi:hypothetical protein